MTKIAAFEEKAYALAAELARLAEEACERRDTNAVHWLVSEERRIARLARQVEMRGYAKR